MAVIHFEWMYEVAEECDLRKWVGKCEYVLEILCSLCAFTFGVGDFNAQCTFTHVVDPCLLIWKDANGHTHVRECSECITRESSHDLGIQSVEGNISLYLSLSTAAL